jgi:hypothetical protein
MLFHVFVGIKGTRVKGAGDITQQPEGVMWSYTNKYVADNKENLFLIGLD